MACVKILKLGSVIAIGQIYGGVGSLPFEKFCHLRGKYADFTPTD